VTGPSGAGKRTLVEDTFGAALARALGQAGAPPLPHRSFEVPPDAISRVVRLERAGRSASARSCVATACGTWGPIRALLAQTREARVRGLGPEHFSFNTALGRCPVCEGLGMLTDTDGTFAGASRTCPDCDGERLGRATRPVRWQGHTAGELLHLDVDASVALFERHRRIRRPLRALAMVGLGHLPLGRPTGSLSGGEHQRLQLARELARAADPGSLRAGALAGTALVLETPSAGLHHHDATGVADGLARMAAAGATILCSDQHPAILAVASRVVTLGPGPGPNGGQVVATHDAPA
jgi:excinuclease ABC subunit A